MPSLQQPFANKIQSYDSIIAKNSTDLQLVAISSHLFPLCKQIRFPSPKACWMVRNRQNHVVKFQNTTHKFQLDTVLRTALNNFSWYTDWPVASCHRKSTRAHSCLRRSSLSLIIQDFFIATTKFFIRHNFQTENEQFISVHPFLFLFFLWRNPPSISFVFQTAEGKQNRK